MKKYELYLTFSIIIISPAPGWDWNGAAAWDTKPLKAVEIIKKHQLEIGLIRDCRSNILKRLSADSDR